MSDDRPVRPDVRSADTVVLERTEYELIPYGDEKLDGVDLFTLDCHICGTPPGHRHHAGCAMGAGRRHVRPPACRDCGVAIGHVHVLGCGIEQCPRCDGQYMSCDCDGSEDSPDGQEDA
jgi:hypothetical protein